MGALIDAAAALALAKRVYQGPIRDMYNLEPGLKNLFDKDTKGRVRISDAGGVLPLAVRPNMQGGFFGDGGPLTTDGASGYKDALFTFTNYQQSIKITGQQLAALTREGPEAFTNILHAELERCVAGFNNIFNKYINFDDRGVLATLSGNATNAANSVCPTATGDRAFFLAPDMVVSAVDPATSQYREKNARIVSIASDLTSFTVDKNVGVGGALAWQAGDLIVQRESFGRALTGLDYHISKNTWLTLDRSTTYANLKGIVQNAGGADISADFLETILARLWQIGVRKDGNFVASWGPDQEAKYKKAGYTLKRFQNADKVNLGFSEAEFHDVTFLLNRDAPVGTVYFFKPSNFFWVVVQELEWGTPDGQSLHIQWQSGASGTEATPLDRYWAPLFWRGQLVTDKPHHMALLHNLGYDTVFRSRPYLFFG